MKYNQFGRITVEKEQEIKELIAIKLIPTDYKNLSFSDLLFVIFGNFFPTDKTVAAKEQSLKMLAVNQTNSLFDLISEQNSDLSQREFYNAALPILGYKIYTDYQIEDPIALFKKNSLPYIETERFDFDNLLHAIYLLLNTRAVNSMTLIDNLAGQGFFADWFGLDNPQFVYFNGKSLPVFDTSKIINEKVYVESDFDTDLDGVRDLLEVTIFRPVETNQNLRVPILYTADPYFGGINDVDSKLHNVDVNLTDATESENYRGEQIENPTKLNPSTEDEETEITTAHQTIYSFNDYMLARGFATVYAGGFGTSNSDGLRSTGSEYETICAKEIIEWLSGNRIAYNTRDRTHQTKAWWSNEKVAMTGKSYLGTLALAVATTGVAGLKTIISEAAISSWYDYYREHGLVVAPIACQGEDLDVLGDLCQSNFNQTALYLKNKDTFLASQQVISQSQDRKTGQYSNFWDVRNYRRQLKNIKCSVVSVHGLNDWNVKPKNVYKLFNQLKNYPVKAKLFLHQGQHTYLNNIASIDFNDCMNLWLTHELLNIQSPALINWSDCLIQDNLESDHWISTSEFNNNLGLKTTYFLNENENLDLTPDSNEIKEFTDVGGKIFHEKNLTESSWEDRFIIGDDDFYASQIRFVSAPLTKTTTIVGRPKIQLRVASSKPYGQLSVALVDFANRKRLTPIAQVMEFNNQPLGYNFGYETQKEFVPDQKSLYKLITKGFCNIQNYADLKHAEKTNPGEFYDLEFELQPTYYSLPEGSEIGMIVYSTDMGMTKRPQETTIYHVDLANSQLILHQK